MVVCTAVHADDWHFRAPPTDFRIREIPQGLSEFERLSLDVQLKGGAPSFPLLLSLFLETRDGVWIESRQDLTLDGSPQRFNLSLESGSLDWRITKGDRLFGRDLLRSVKRWGIRVYSPELWEGTLSVGSLKTFPVRSVELNPVFELRDADRVLKAGLLNTISVGIEPMLPDPFDPASVPEIWVKDPDDNVSFLKAAWVQEYRRRRFPGRMTAESLPWREPVYRSLWKPGKAGTYTVGLKWGKQEMSLGSVTVEPATELPVSAEQQMLNPDFLGTSGSSRVWRWDPEQQEWLPEQVAEVWTPGLDWTSAWTMYAGLGEFSQARSAEFEDQLKASSRKAPLQLVSEHILDDRTRFNWKDHPWNAQNGGDLLRPMDLWTRRDWKDLILRRAVYLWSRYGAYPQVTGLYLDVERASQFHVYWLEELRKELEQVLPGVPIFSPSPGLPTRQDLGTLELNREGWDQPDGMAGAERLITKEGELEVTLLGPSESGFDVSLGAMQHWSNAQVLQLDVEPRFEVNDFPQFQLQARTTPDRLFASPVYSLHNGEINRLYIPLDDPAVWTCIGKPDQPWSPLERMNVRELLVRVYTERDDPGAAFRLHDARLVSHPVIAPAGALTPLSVTDWHEPESGTRMELAEWVFSLSRFFRNPYDPDEIAVDLHVVLPDGTERTHPGFFYQHTRRTLTEEGENWELLPRIDWRVRFRPWMEGTHQWKVVIRAKEGDGTSIEIIRKGDLEVQPNPSVRGFLRQAAKDPRFFEFPNGEFFYPVGHTMRSPTDRRPGIYDQSLMDTLDKKDAMGTETYAVWFRRMEETGGNFARIWISNWWLGLEWNSRHTGYHGRKYFNQTNAARLDRVIELAETHGVYMNVETTNHGTFSSTVDGEWDENPWSHYSVDEGPVRYASEFFTNKEALRWHEHKMRYLIARAGHSPSIALWGVLTESEWSEAYFRSFRGSPGRNRIKPWHPQPFGNKSFRQPFKDWTDRTAIQLRDENAHPVLVSTHFSNPGNGLDFWQLDSLRVLYNNAYSGFFRGYRPSVLKPDPQEVRRTYPSFSGDRDPWDGIVREMLGYESHFRRHAKGEKIILVGEWGGRPTRNLDSHLEAEFHTGSWAAVMTSLAGVSGYWWFNLVEYRDLFSTYRAISAFMEGEDLREKKFVTERWAVLFPRERGRTRRLAVGKSTRNEAFVYVYPPEISHANKSQVARGFNDPEFPISGKGWLAVPKRMRDGLYQLEAWNTFTGKRFLQQEVPIGPTLREVPLPSHRVDVALKLRYVRELTLGELPPLPTPVPPPTPTPMPRPTPTPSPVPTIPESEPSGPPPGRSGPHERAPVAGRGR